MFNATFKWWGDRGQRYKPHEGIDLCLYMDGRNRMLRINGEIRIPVLYDGVIVRIIDDFLGKTVIAEHRLSDSDNDKFYTIFGHVQPNDRLCEGKKVEQGEIFASLTATIHSKTAIVPHVHISLGRPSKPIAYDRLDWETINDPRIFVLLDPIDLVDGNYTVLEDADIKGILFSAEPGEEPFVLIAG